MSHRCAVSMIIGVSFAFVSTCAYAETVQEAVYKDTKDLIEDLINQEAAKSATDVLACYSPELLPYYFPETLSAAHKGKWGDLALSSRMEAAAAIGEWVRTIVAQQQTSLSLAGFFKAATLPNGMVEPTTELPFTLREACINRFGKRLPEYAGWFAQHPGHSNEAAAKNVENSRLKGDEVRAVSDKLDEVLAKYLQRPTGEGPLSQCTVAYLSDQVAYACEMGLLAQSLALQEKDRTLDHVVGLASIPFAAALAHPAASDKPPSSFYENWLMVKEALSSFVKARDGGLPGPSDLGAKLAAAGFHGMGEPAPEHLHAVGLHLRHVVAQELSASSIQQAISGLVQLEASGLKATAYKDVLLKVVYSAEFTTLLKSLGTGDGARIAYDSVALALIGMTDYSNSYPDRAAAKAILAVLKYTSETREGRAPSTAARETAREALFEYLTTTGKPGYISTWHNIENRFGGEWATLSLQGSYCPSYINSGKDSARFAASAEFLMLKVRLSTPRRWTYSALTISMFDLLGPFREFALRDNRLDYRESQYVWANWLHPRLDVVFGVPSFSRKLAVFAGVGAVPIAPIRDNDGKYEYMWLLQRRDDRPDSKRPLGEYLPNFFDLAVGLRYYPF